MATPDTLLIWLKLQALPLAILAILALAAWGLLKLSARRRHAALSRERRGITEVRFVHHLKKFGFEPVIAGTTYRYLQDVQKIPFPILPSDKLDEDLGLDSEDVDQTVRELLVALGRVESPGLRYQPLQTVEDLVRHMQASPRKSNVAA